MTATRFPFAPLAAILAGRGVTTNAEMARELGVTRRTVQRWPVSGLTEVAADAAAVALGVLPGEVWAAWGEAQRAEAARLEAERRAKDAARQRRAYRNPTKRERRMQHSRAYKAAAAEVLARKNALYREANREALRERQRAYYQRKKAAAWGCS